MHTIHTHTYYTYTYYTHTYPHCHVCHTHHPTHILPTHHTLTYYTYAIYVHTLHTYPHCHGCEGCLHQHLCSMLLSVYCNTSRQARYVFKPCDCYITTHGLTYNVTPNGIAGLWGGAGGRGGRGVGWWRGRRGVCGSAARIKQTSITIHMLHRYIYMRHTFNTYLPIPIYTHISSPPQHTYLKQTSQMQLHHHNTAVLS